MPNARIWIFDVDHGSCAFVRFPSGNTLMIDCGRRHDFSPARYIYDSELSQLERDSQHKVDKLVVSHPHDDHIEDIHNVRLLLNPRVLLQQEYNWPDVKEAQSADYENLREYVSWQDIYNEQATEPDWGGWSVSYFCVPVEVAKTLAGSTINNSSYVVVANRGPFKIVLPGDLEVAGWEYLLENPAFRAAINGTRIFVTSHHGHDSGFTPLIYDAMGLPDFNVISCHYRDESVCSSYRSEGCASGVQYNNGFRRSFTTRSDHSLLLEVDEYGRYQGTFFELAPNESTIPGLRF